MQFFRLVTHQMKVAPLHYLLQEITVTVVDGDGAYPKIGLRITHFFLYSQWNNKAKLDKLTVKRPHHHHHQLTVTVHKKQHTIFYNSCT